MQVAKVLKAPLFFSRLLFKLKRQKGGRDVAYILSDRLGMRAESAITVGKALKIIVSPLKARERFQVRSVPSSVPVNLTQDGWIKLPKDAVEGAFELAQHCADLFARKRDQVLAAYAPPFTLVTNIHDAVENPEEIEPIVRFCSQPALFNLIASYLGEYPVLNTISLGYTAANAGRVGSQLFHRDLNDRRAAHLVMPIWPIDMDSGPFTFLPARESAQLQAEIKHNRGRISDDVIFSHVDNDDFVYCTGAPGDVFLVNPYACFHCGARTRSKPRLILIVSFSSIFQGMESNSAVFQAVNRHLLDDGRRETRLLLNL